MSVAAPSSRDTGSQRRCALAPNAVPGSRLGPRPSLLVVHPGAELYGADRMLLESATALATRFDVTVALPGHGPLVGALRERGLRVVLCPMPVLRQAALRPRGALRLLADAARGAGPALRLIRRHGAAGVYINTLTLPSWPLLARLARRPSLCHVHEAEKSAPRILRLGMALCPAISDRVVANSRFTLEVLTDVAPRLASRTTVIHNAVTAPDEAVPPREQLTGPLRLLFMGRLSPRKGPQVALETLAELVSRGIDARLGLVGAVFEGYEWFEAELRRIIDARGLADRVEFLGFRPDIWPHLAAADVVLVPSVAEESFGNAAVEAVLAARPLVISATSGLLEAVAGYAGVQAVDPGRPANFADAVERVLADWSGFRRAVTDDACEARRRHSLQRYGERLLAAAAALLPDTTRSGPGSGIGVAPRALPGG